MEIHDDDDITIINNLLRKKYDIQKISLEHIIKYIFIIHIQIMGFEDLFDSNNSSGLSWKYTAGEKKFNGNEADLLYISQLCKNLNPIKTELLNEFYRRGFDNNLFHELWKNSVDKYVVDNKLEKNEINSKVEI